MAKFTLIAVIRNQAPYIVEWVAHHLALGVEHFVLCVHGSSDGTARITRRLAAMGYAAHVKLTVSDNDVKSSVLSQIGNLEEVASADWVGLQDVDQFLNSHMQHGSLRELFEHVPDTNDAISVRCDLFGSNDVQNISDEWVTQTFPKRATRKTTKAKEPVILARSLEALTAPKQIFEVGPNDAQVNAYRCKSAENLAVRLITPLDQTVEEIKESWNLADRNDVEDSSIDKYRLWTERYYKTMLTDRRLHLAQQSGRDWHKDRAQTARDQRLL